MTHPIEINQQDFEEQVVKCDTPVLIDFWAPWCGPCRSLSPTLEQLAQEFAGRLKVVKLNIDDNQELASAAGVRSIPTVMLFADGQVQNVINGARPLADYRTAIDALLGTAEEVVS